MKSRRGKTKWEDLLSIILLMLIGLMHSTQYLPQAARGLLRTASLPLMGVILVVSWYQSEKYNHLPPEERRDLDRQWEDERGVMVQRQAVHFCWQVEIWLLFGLYIPITFGMGRQDLATVVFELMILRSVFFYAVRWWFNRKY